MMYTRTRSSRCLKKYGAVSTHKHSTYEKKIQDLTFWGKRTYLLINAYEYQCDDPSCEVTLSSRI